MSIVRARGEDVRRYILEHVEEFPRDIAKRAAAKFGITRQAVNKHLRKLTEEKALTESGETRSRVYKLAPLASWEKSYALKGLQEDLVWSRDVAPILGQLPDNVRNIWQYGITEMVNNAIDHSGGTTLTITIEKTATATLVHVTDDGVGIFRKIQKALNLLDERHAVLELAKGKFTTDPKNHSGEGVFFTSRMFDEYDILSGAVFFGHTSGRDEDWILERQKKNDTGTMVTMKLNNHTSRTMKKVFDQFTIGDDFGFNKTVVPVELAQYGGDQLVSRSQAKRLLSRVELFKVVVLDFGGVKEIGQGFADEIFRVFVNRHPEITIEVMHANSAVKRMIERAKSRGVTEELPAFPTPDLFDTPSDGSSGS